MYMYPQADAPQLDMLKQVDPDIKKALREVSIWSAIYRFPIVHHLQTI